jgi:hypothetical protein
MTLGEILDRTVSIYRAKFLLFAGISMLPTLAAGFLWLAGFLLTELFASAPNFPLVVNALHGSVGRWLPALWPMGYARYLTWPAMAYLASRILFDEKPTLLSAIWWCASRWKSWLALAAIYWVIFDWLPFAARILAIGWYYHIDAAEKATYLLPGRSSLPPQALAALLTFATLVMGAVFHIALSASAPVWTLERRPVRDAMRRGWEIGKGVIWEILVAWATINVISWVLETGVTALIILASRALPFAFVDPRGNFILSYRLVNAGVQVVGVLIAPLFPIAMTLLYFDQRVRKEGYDIELLMTAAGMDAASTSEGANGPAAAQTRS